MSQQTDFPFDGAKFRKTSNATLKEDSVKPKDIAMILSVQTDRSEQTV